MVKRIIINKNIPICYYYCDHHVDGTRRSIPPHAFVTLSLSLLEGKNETVVNNTRNKINNSSDDVCDDAESSPSYKATV